MANPELVASQAMAQESEEGRTTAIAQCPYCGVGCQLTYHIKDGDGSEAEATLTINLRPVTLVADNESVGVNEASLDLVQDDRTGTLNDDLAAANTTGSLPGSPAETVSGQLGMTFGFEIPIFAEVAAALSKAGSMRPGRAGSGHGHWPHGCF